MNKKILCSIQSSILQVMKQLDQNAQGIVFLVDEAEKLKGVITDGDIRRAILDGFQLSDDIDKIVKDNYVYAHEGDNIEDILQKFNYMIKFIPIVDSDQRIIDYYEYRQRVRMPIAQPQIDGREYEYLTDAFTSTWISSSGEYITRFENEFSAYCTTRYGVAVSNGTTALHLALTALNIGPGDEVIVPDLTFAATINAVLHAGAVPVIVDIEEEGWCIDPKEIEKAITERTKAIIPVHLYGQPCNMKAIMEIAGRYSLRVIEDCAEAHGAEFAGQKVGSFGDIGCFSFFGNKVITTGEGGMCITSDKQLEERMRLFRDHGMSKERKYYHTVVGFNYRMTNLQAAIGVAQLEKIELILSWREKLEELYRAEFSKSSIIKMQENKLLNRKKITWLVSVMVQGDRDRYMEKLKKEGIDVRPFFIPLSEMDLYKQYVFSDTNSKRIAKSGMNLPTFHKMTEANILKIGMIIQKTAAEANSMVEI